ncbi:MAG: hypothetical protein AAF614_34810 [Chloroflexota bacterium]
MAAQSEQVRIHPDSRTAVWYGHHTAYEQFNCSYGLNPLYREALEKSALTVAGVGNDNEVRIVESQKHRFFIAVLFLPQLASQSGPPHPLIAAFLKAAQTT